ncbi:hypothetical protein [Lysobacter gummosus]|uniref:hypothetical protein n=1 Tax=Lysobacter gummosus TaxID=262324 RepID=UPI0036403C6D
MASPINTYSSLPNHHLRTCWSARCDISRRQDCPGQRVRTASRPVHANSWARVRYHRRTAQPDRGLTRRRHVPDGSVLVTRSEKLGGRRAWRPV